LRERRLLPVTAGGGVSKRVAQKQAARIVREQIAKERRRTRTMWTSIIAVLVLVIAGAVGWTVYSSQHSSAYTAPPGAVDNGSGIKSGSGAVTVDLYEDFMCPHCKVFETQSGAALDQFASNGKATLVFHPIAILDGSSTTQYSTRSSAAAGCAAAEGKYREYAKALFAQQPAEGSAGLTDDQLVSIGTSLGLSDATFGKCVRAGTYRAWTQHVTDAASAKGVTGTPTVMVNGKQVDPTTQAITNAVTAAAP
jgi:protein-disulfide isomerase